MNPSTNPQAVHLKAAAGGAGGSWYVLLEGLAKLVAEIYPHIRIEVVEGGGVENHSRVGSGEPDMAILNPPMTAAALAGREPYLQTFPDIRIAIANLTVNHLHFLVEKGIPMESLADGIQKKYPLRIPIDRVGTVDRLVFRLALAHLGASEGNIETWGGKTVPAMTYDEQLGLYERGEVNSLWQFMGIPSPSIQAAHDIRPLKLLPMPESLIAELDSLGWSPAEIPAGAYGATDGPVPTVSMGTSIGFHASVPEEVVFAITSAICQHPELVRKIHPAAKEFDPKQACLNARGPLHPGAEKFFRGIL